MLITNENYLAAVNKLFGGCNLKETVYNQITRYFSGNSDDIKITAEIRAIKYMRGALTEFGSSVFSLIQLKEILTRIINFFLSSEKYNELAEIIGCCAVNSSYSETVYKSVREEYGIDERPFDRFVEMLNSTGIAVSKYVPMFLYALDAPAGERVKIWIRPVKEYFSRKNNYDRLVEYTGKYRSINGYALLLEINSEFAVDKIVEILLFSQNTRKSDYRTLLTGYKLQTVRAVTPYLKDANIYVREQAVKALLIFKSDQSVFARLSQCYIDETTSRVKNLIARECGLKDEGLKLGGIQEMLDFCSDYGDEKIPKNLPALSYDTGEEIDKHVYAAIISILSEQRKPLILMTQVKEIAKFISAESLINAAEQFYGQINYGADKFKLAFCILFGSAEILDKELQRQYALLDTEEFNSRRFVMPALRGGESIKKFYYNILNDESRKKIHKHVYAALDLICDITGENIEDLLDESVNTFNLNEKGSLNNIRISPELEVIVSPKRNLPVAAAIEKEIRAEVKRMETAMIEGRKWTRDNFYKNILGNPILNKIAGTLFFSEYKYNKLNNIFIVEDGIRLLDNSPYRLMDGAAVMVSHPLELREKFNNLKINNIYQPFMQAERDYFTPTADDISRNSVERFNSYLVDDTILMKSLKAYGWTPAAPLESGAITHCTKTISGVIGTITFREPVYLHRQSTVSIGHIRFYPQKSAVKYFVPNKSKPVGIAGMDKRAFSEFLYDVSRIVKGN